MSKVKDPIQPDYYKGKSGQDVIDIAFDYDLSYCLSSAIKYIIRAGKKSNSTKSEDLRKAQEFISREIQFINNSK